MTLTSLHIKHKRMHLTAAI